MISETKEQETIFEEADFETVRESSGVTVVKQKNSRRPVYIVAAILLLTAVIGLVYWFYARQFETTDNAFIEGDIVQVNPKIDAYVSKVLVKENQFVRKGDLLVELDSRDIEARIAQEQARISVARAREGSAKAAVNLTRQTANAGQMQARSGVETAQYDIDQTRVAANAKQNIIRQAETAVKTAQANLAQMQAQVSSAQSAVSFAQSDADRYRELYSRGDISAQRYQQATTALETAQSQLNAVLKQVEAGKSKVNEAAANVAVAREEYNTSLAQIELSKSKANESAGKLREADTAPQKIAVDESQTLTAGAEIRQAETSLAQAELELSYTKIYAPQDGYVSRRAVQEGQFVKSGTALMAISQSDVWVVANFKETQLGKMSVGQPVEIYVDAYPDKIFRGRIESFQAGTGSRFSVLPAENAGGNFVKVVQRIPVRIVFEEKPENVNLLVPGMSVQPRVKVR